MYRRLATGSTRRYKAPSWTSHESHCSFLGVGISTIDSLGTETMSHFESYLVIRTRSSEPLTHRKSPILTWPVRLTQCSEEVNTLSLGSDCKSHCNVLKLRHMAASLKVH